MKCKTVGKQLAFSHRKYMMCCKFEVNHCVKTKYSLFNLCTCKNTLLFAANLGEYSKTRQCHSVGRCKTCNAEFHISTVH